MESTQKEEELPRKLSIPPAPTSPPPMLPEHVLLPPKPPKPVHENIWKILSPENNVAVPEPNKKKRKKKKKKKTEVQKEIQNKIQGLD